MKGEREGEKEREREREREKYKVKLLIHVVVHSSVSLINGLFGTFHSPKPMERSQVSIKNKFTEYCPAFTS